MTTLNLLEPIVSKNSNMDKLDDKYKINRKNNKNSSIFIQENLNLDINQSLALQEKKRAISNNNNKDNNNNNNNNNNIESISESINYLNCVGNNCSKIDNSYTIPNSNSNSNSSVNSPEISISTNVSNVANLSKNKTQEFLNYIQKNLDVMISFVYIFLITLLLVNSVLNRNNHSLVQMLVLTLLYVFYKLFIGSK
jgi:hypothetical protein